jgi:hypothetical protein
MSSNSCVATRSTLRADAAVIAAELSASSLREPHRRGAKASTGSDLGRAGGAAPAVVASERATGQVGFDLDMRDRLGPFSGGGEVPLRVGEQGRDSLVEVRHAQIRHRRPPDDRSADATPPVNCASTGPVKRGSDAQRRSEESAEQLD